MVFNIGAVAGPSRLPLLSRAAFNVSRRCASGKAPADDAVDAQADADAAVEVDSDIAPQEAKSEMGSGYREWLANIGETFEHHKPGQKALWLGGSIPFPQNPTFRPPPPLSNDLQNVIADRHHAGENLGQLSQAFGISKARIEAVLKLKELEARYKRQNVPLQEAFLKGMEPLLGVRSPLSPKKTIDVVLSRQEQQARDDHPSGQIELAEQERFEKGVGAGGAFGMGDLMPGQQAVSEETGMEGLAWEFRAEDDKDFKPTPFNRNAPIVAETGENLAQAAPVTPPPAAAPTKTQVNGEFRFINSIEIGNTSSKNKQKLQARKKQAKA